MIKRLVCVVTLLGLMTGLAGCFLTRISASRPLIGDELAQVRTGLSLSEVRDLFGEPYRTGSWQEYVDEARTETVLYEDWALDPRARLEPKTAKWQPVYTGVQRKAS